MGTGLYMGAGMDINMTHHYKKSNILYYYKNASDIFPKKITDQSILPDIKTSILPTTPTIILLLYPCPASELVFKDWSFSIRPRTSG